MPDRLFQELAENAPVMIWRSGRDRRCDWFNRQWLDFVGEDMVSAVRNDWLAQVHPDDRESVASAYALAFDDQVHLALRFRMQRRDGAWRTVAYTGAPFARGGVFAGFFGSCTDVTEQQEIYDRLELAYRERDGLLRELYHRVKNNLQQIDGLIAIEAAAIQDEPAREALLALSGRVRAMGRVHQMLLKSRDLTHISAREFLQSLCDSIGHANGAGRRGIGISVVADDAEIDIERAVVKGLIVNELVANSLKHAFPAGMHGFISVRFNKAIDNSSKLEVEDNGAGIREAANREAGGSHIGMTLVRGLCEQLNGHLEFVTPAAGGCLARIRFPAHAESRQ